MYTELINATNYANIYVLYADNGQVIGIKEVTLAGRYAGTRYISNCAMSKREIRAAFASVKAESV